MRHLHRCEQVYLSDSLFESCGGEKKKNVNLAKVRDILDSFPDLINDEVGPKRSRGPVLIIAVKSGNLELIQYLLKNDQLNFYCRDDEGWTALHWAVMKGYDLIVQELLRACEGLINVINDSSRSPLHISAMIGNVTITEILLKICKVNIHLKDKYGDTALHLAVESTFMEIISLLLTRDARLHCNKDGLNPFHVAARDGKSDVVQLFLQFPIDVDKKSKTGKTAVQLADEWRKDEVVRILSDPAVANRTAKEDQCTIA